MSTDPHPPDSNTTIWRFVDDWKFAEILGRFSQHRLWQDDPSASRSYNNGPGQLWFSYPWAFEDAYEGTLPSINDNPDQYYDCVAAARGLPAAEAAEQKRRFLAADSQVIRDCNVLLAQLSGVSCWHSSVAVSSRMWDFAGPGNGVAIKTTVGQLEHALTWTHDPISARAQPSVCAVGYVDYSSYFLQYDGFRNILAIVEKSWSYENEIRFVAKSPSILRLPMQISMPWQPPEPFPVLTADDVQQHLELIRSNARSEFSALRGSNSEGFNLPINLEGLIHEVVIKPGADATYANSVRNLLDNCGLCAVPITRP